VALVGVVTVGEPLLMVVEFMEHGSLNSYLKSKEPSEQQLIIMARDIADGLWFEERERRKLNERRRVFLRVGFSCAQSLFSSFSFLFLFLKQLSRQSLVCTSRHCHA
jgi:hypothetical protein